MGKAWGIATEFVASIMGSFLVGFAIDSYFNTLPTWSLVMLLIGLTYAVWRIVRRTMEDEKREKAEKAREVSPTTTSLGRAVHDRACSCLLTR